MHSNMHPTNIFIHIYVIKNAKETVQGLGFVGYFKNLQRVMYICVIMDDGPYKDKKRREQMDK